MNLIAVDKSYYDMLGRIESNNNPLARATTSSASGLYQFTQKTWEGLGFHWGDVFNVSSQNDAIRKLTGQNANALSQSGISINNGSLYAAHFLGIGDAKKVLSSDPTKALKDALGKRWDTVSKANPFLKDMSVGDFGNWLKEKTGDNPLSNGAGNILDGAKDALGNINPVTAARAAMGDPTAWAQIGMDVLGGGGEKKDSGIVAWLKEFFSINTAVRFLAVVVGIVLVAAAVAALLYQNKTVRAVVNTAISKGATVAAAAV